MKAIVVEAFGGPHVMQIREIAGPRPGPGDVLISVRSAGVNPVDTYIRAGAYPVLPELPYTPGMDAAGVVVETGADVTRFRVGDRVYHTGRRGGYAELLAAAEDTVHPLPETISFSQGASIGVPAGAAWRAMFLRGKAKAGEIMLVHGASGAAGLTAVQLGAAAGLRVLGTAGTDKGLNLVASLGAEAVFSHQGSDYVDRIKEQTAGKGVDLILEMLANNNLENDLELLAPRGRVVIIGNRGRIEIDPRATMGKETDIRGMSLFAATQQESRQTHAALVGAMRAGFFKPVIAREFPLDQAPEAHRKVMESGNCGNLVLVT